MKKERCRPTSCCCSVTVLVAYPLPITYLCTLRRSRSGRPSVTDRSPRYTQFLSNAQGKRCNLQESLEGACIRSRGGDVQRWALCDFSTLSSPSALACCGVLQVWLAARGCTWQEQLQCMLMNSGGQASKPVRPLPSDYLSSAFCCLGMHRFSSLISSLQPQQTYAVGKVRRAASYQARCLQESHTSVQVSCVADTGVGAMRLEHTTHTLKQHCIRQQLTIGTSDQF